MKRILHICICLFLANTIFAQSNQSNPTKTVNYNCYFDYNSAVWTKDSIAKFEKWFKPYLEKDEIVLELKAFTDTIGKISNNKLLAERRLNTVESYLNQQKIGINLSKVIGEEYSKTAYSNDQLYRKVAIKITFREKLVAVQKDGVIEQQLKERIQTFANSTEPVNLNIQFVGGQDVYLDDSYLDVVALLMYLKQNPKKAAFIRGHVCCQNDLELSMRRAYAVYNDLILEGISPNRISYKGFGNTIPIAQELDEFSRQQNRRVDVIFSE